jgi:predicted nucleotidyltransferase
LDYDAEMLKMFEKPISRSAIDPALKAIVAALVYACSPKRIILTGSVAEGRATTGSDIDLIVTFDDETARRSAPGAFAKVRPKRDWAVDILWLLDREFERKASVGGICQIAKEDGEVLFEKGKGTRD